MTISYGGASITITPAELHEMLGNGAGDIKEQIAGLVAKLKEGLGNLPDIGKTIADKVK